MCISHHIDINIHTPLYATQIPNPTHASQKALTSTCTNIPFPYPHALYTLPSYPTPCAFCKSPISTHSVRPKDHSRPAPAVPAPAAFLNSHIRPVPRGTGRQSVSSPAFDWAGAPAAAEAGRSPAVALVADSGPIAAAVAVAGPTAGVVGVVDVGAVLEAERRIAGVRGAKRGCTGVVRGCKTGLSGVRVGGTAGRIRGGEGEVGKSLMLRRRIAGVT